MEYAAIYCRSSKDRAEVGLDTQRKELHDFAAVRKLSVLVEFSDMEISGSLDETSRPGLRSLLAALREPNRKWNVLLVLDTSRLARDPMLGLYITRECEKAGVRVEYSKMPIDGTSAFGETMLQVLRAFDRLHARLSTEKGRAGMETNVEKGFRVGGRAPFGYKLKKHDTGTLRGSMPVQKSTLVPDKVNAPKVQAFLKARALGESRTIAARDTGLSHMATASLVGIERNALTYAGYQVWNMRQKHKPTREDPRRTMFFRPREEWKVSEIPTHEALISKAEAEKILASFETTATRRPAVRAPDEYVLAGLLYTPEGAPYWVDGHDKAYRAGNRGRRINATWLEGEVLCKIADDFGSSEFIAGVVNEARQMADRIEADPQALEAEIRSEQKRLDNLLNVAAEAGSKAILQKIKETEDKIATLRSQRAEWLERADIKRKLQTITAADIHYILALNGLEIRDGDGALEILGYTRDDKLDSGQLRRVFKSLLERVELDPRTRTFTLKYRLPVHLPKTGVEMASPGRSGANSGEFILMSSTGQLPRQRPRRVSAISAN